MGGDYRFLSAENVGESTSGNLKEQNAPLENGGQKCDLKQVQAPTPEEEDVGGKNCSKRKTIQPPGEIVRPGYSLKTIFFGE
ncbi:MAG: hypothetical protein E3J45_05440 [Candidatus Zixiibacteriota bacterium]|nr:MAG: hypothetical protein E3J45_05440 [candidate division Zixibacteria bacterium]